MGLHYELRKKRPHDVTYSMTNTSIKFDLNYIKVNKVKRIGHNNDNIK